MNTISKHRAKIIAALAVAVVVVGYSISARADARTAAAFTSKSASQLRKVGYYLPDGEYVCTWHRVLVGYNAWGQPIFSPVCD